MPLLLTTHPFPDTAFGLWQIAEEEAFFRDEMPLTAAEETELAKLKNIRRMEWLASRWLLHKLTGAPQRLPLAKDAFSKPFFSISPTCTAPSAIRTGSWAPCLPDKMSVATYRCRWRKCPSSPTSF